MSSQTGIRRLRFGLVLPLFLLFAQHGAALHELIHLSYLARSGGADVHHSQNLLDNRLCLACYSFAQVTSPTAGAAPALDSLRGPCLTVLEPSCPAVDRDTPTPRSRGPPHLQA